MPPLTNARRRNPQLDAAALARSAAPGIHNADDEDVTAQMPAPMQRVVRRREARAQGVSPGVESAQLAHTRALDEAKARLAEQAAQGAAPHAEGGGAGAGDVLQRIAEALNSQGGGPIPSRGAERSPGPGLGAAKRAGSGQGLREAATALSDPAQAVAEAVALGGKEPRGPVPLPLPIDSPRLPGGQGRQRRPRRQGASPLGGTLPFLFALQR